MAAGAWKIFTQAKFNLGQGSINLKGNLRMCLMTSGVSAALSNDSFTGISSWTSISASEISPRGGYAANGRLLPNADWTVGASVHQIKLTYTATGIIFTANGSPLNNIKYAVIRTSSGAGVGLLVCYSTLSTSPFTINSPNTLTIFPHANGVFTLA